LNLISKKLLMRLYFFFFFHMEPISFLPHYISFGHLQLSQTLITSLFSSVLFLLFILLYQLIKHFKPYNTFTWSIDLLIEEMTEFFMWVSGWLSYKVVGIIVFVFFYILWINLVWLLGDWFVLVIPSLHDYFRPVATDLTFNLLLAGFFVVGSIVFWFYHHGLHYIEKYIPYKGMWIVTGRSIISYILKPLDIVVWLFIGLIELVGEIAKILSLSLRLFGNILAGMVLMWMVIFAATNIFHVPLIMPILVFAMELLVSFIQAFVFSMLILVYFRMAAQWHH